MGYGCSAFFVGIDVIHHQGNIFLGQIIKALSFGQDAPY